MIAKPLSRSLPTLRLTNGHYKINRINLLNVEKTYCQFNKSQSSIKNILCYFV